MLQFRLIHRKVIRWRCHHGGGARIGGPSSHAQGFGQRRVAYAGEHRHAVANLPAGPLDQIAAKLVAQPGTFTRSAQDKQPLNPAGKHMLDKPFEAGLVELIVGAQRGNQRRDDAAQDPRKARGLFH